MSEQLFMTLLLLTLAGFSVFLFYTIRRSRPSTGVFISVVAAVTFWLIVTPILLTKEFFTDNGYPAVSLASAVAGPFIVGLVAYRWSSQLRSAIARLTTSDFLRIQYWRSPFGVFFFFTEELPLWFQLVGGLGDIAAGLGAAAAHRYFQNNPNDERRSIIAGNVTGLVDFAVVLTLGLGFVVPGQTLDFGFNLIPMFAVPLFFLTHAASVARLRREA